MITDGGAQTGLGHVQQSITLAHELRDKANVTFITKSGLIVSQKISDSGFDVTTLASDEEIFRKLEHTLPDVIIFDKIDVDENFARRIRIQLPSKLIIFTNLTPANKFAHAAITADIGSNFENIRFTDDETGTQYLYGPKYWVLRREFNELKNKPRIRSDAVNNILLIFGGSDPANLTVQTLKQLTKITTPFTINVIVGANYCHDADLHAFLQSITSNQNNINIFRNIPNVAELMHEADLTIASPGLSAFEALKVGSPLIVVPQDMLQRDTYKGYICMLEIPELNKIGEIITLRQFTFPNQKNIMKMEIGEGIQELKDLILLQDGGRT
ncbi:MAG: glycosyltransferase [Acidobacteriota bacterium]